MIPLYDSHRTHHWPLMLFLLIVINAIFFYIQFTASETQAQYIAQVYGMVPRRITDRPWAVGEGFPTGGIVSAFTCMFLHGGVLHLVMNMWSLYIFGDNVEDRMGPFRFLVFYLLCGLAASATHVISAPASTIPTVGASGAIAGVLGAYMLMFPKATVTTLIMLPPIVRVVPIASTLYLAIWFIIQIVSGFVSRNDGDGVGGVAWWAHIGGFVAGLVLYRFFVRRNHPHDDNNANTTDDSNAPLSA